MDAGAYIAPLSSLDYSSNGSSIEYSGSQPWISAGLAQKWLWLRLKIPTFL